MIVDLLNRKSGAEHPNRGGHAWRPLTASALVLSIVVAMTGQAQATSIESGVAARVIGTATESILVETRATGEEAALGSQRLEIQTPSPDADAPHSVTLSNSFEGVSGDGAVRADVNRRPSSLVVRARDLAPDNEPMVDYGTLRPTAISVNEVLRSVVTLQGDPAPPGPAPSSAQRASAGSTVPFGSVRGLVLELLEEHVSPLGTENGKTVFSILGAGLFTLEVARNGSGIRLSELASGKSFLLGADSDERLENARAHRNGTESDTRPEGAATETVLRSGSDELQRQGSLPALISTIADALTSIPRFIIEIASSPFILLVLLPLALLWFLVETLRQRTTAETSKLPSTDKGTTNAVPANRPRRRRRRGKRVRWRTIFAEIRTSLGFPQAELIREDVPKARRSRRRRRRVTVG